MNNKTLLEKYNIPVAHLDFEYIKTSTNAREIEKIVIILRSGEEGYFPDLLKCAEDKLHLLKPNSKCFRKDEPVLTKDMLDRKTWENLNDDIKIFEDNMKHCNNHLRGNNLKKDKITNIPPVRQLKDINYNKDEKVNNTMKNQESSQRIKSLEYDKWDKYDAESQALKIDFDEERNREFIEMKNNKNIKNNVENSKVLIEDISNDIDCLSIMEREIIGRRHKEQGNDYFRNGEYNEAIEEYTKFIRIYPCAIAFNNRAQAYLKIKKNENAIDDCNSCLKIEPTNMKALLRKAQGFMNENKPRHALKIYLEIKTLDPNNTIANNNIVDLTKKYPDMPPQNAHRIVIEEVNCKTNKPEEEIIKDIDFSQLIKPNKIVENKFQNVIKKNVKNLNILQKQKNFSRLKENSKELLCRDTLNTNKVGAIIEEIYD